MFSNRTLSTLAYFPYCSPVTISIYFWLAKFTANVSFSSIKHRDIFLHSPKWSIVMIKPARFCNKCYTDQVKTFQQNNKSNNSRLNHTLFIYTNYHLITVHTTKLTSRENTRSSITTCVLKCHYLHVFNQHQLNSILLILLTFPRLTTVPLAYFDTVGTRENSYNEHLSL